MLTIYEINSERFPGKAYIPDIQNRTNGLDRFMKSILSNSEKQRRIDVIFTFFDMSIGDGYEE